MPLAADTAVVLVGDGLHVGAVAAHVGCRWTPSSLIIRNYS